MIVWGQDGEDEVIRPLAPSDDNALAERRPPHPRDP